MSNIQCPSCGASVPTASRRWRVSLSRWFLILTAICLAAGWVAEHYRGKNKTVPELVGYMKKANSPIMHVIHQDADGTRCWLTIVLSPINPTDPQQAPKITGAPDTSPLAPLN